MATNIILRTFEGELNTSQHDAVVRDLLVQMNGVIKGCEVNYLNSNIIHVSAGFGMIKGRLFEIFDNDIPVEMPLSGEYSGRLYIHMDLGNADEPVTLKAITGSSLPDLVQDENCNYNNGTYDLEICSFTAQPLEITDLSITVKNIYGVLDKLREDCNRIFQTFDEVLLVSELPSDADQHPKTLYLIG